MNNKSINIFARQLVRNYSNYDTLENRYVLDVSDIPSFVLSHFASLFMQDRISANEACGSDNSEFDKIMLPSLIKFLVNPFSQDNQKDFMDAWKNSVTNYFHKDMQSIIDDALALYNVESAA